MIVSALTVLAQSTSQDQPTGDRLIELLRHPGFFTLRLRTPEHSVREKPTDAPAPFYEGDSISFQLFITQNSSSSVTVWSEVDPYFQYRPELTRDGDVLPLIVRKRFVWDGDWVESNPVLFDVLPQKGI